ncbi:MAG TPA: hypothetical protein VMM38_09530 [Aridibacter sp.]|nr:hypothetical protein [Aridibacter sp.]
MRTTFVLLFILIFCSLTANAQVSRYAAEMAENSRRAQAVSNETMEMVRQGESDPEVIVSVGNRFVDEFDRSIGSLRAYKNAKTRFGLQSELDDLLLMSISFREGYQTMLQLTGEPGSGKFDSREIGETNRAFNDEFVPFVKDLVDMHLGAQGVSDFLTDPGFDTASGIVANTLIAEGRSFIRDELEKLTRLQIRPGRSLKDHLLTALRQSVSRKVSGVIVRMAAGHFIVEMFAVKLIDWIGPKLREFFRPKGNLNARVERAIEGMRNRANRLNAMKTDAATMDVRRHVEAAEAHVKANRHLWGDIKRAGEEPLIIKLAVWEHNLEQAVRLAKTRFLIGSALVQVRFDEMIAGMEEMRDTLRSALGEMASGRRAPGDRVNEAASDWSMHGVAMERGNPIGPAEFPGMLRVEIETAESGLNVKVTAENGALLFDGFVKRSQRFSAGTPGRYEARNVKWIDGSNVDKLILESTYEEGGVPTKGVLYWRKIIPNVHYLLHIRFSSSRLETVDREVFDGTFRRSAVGTKADFPGTYGVEISGRQNGFQVRVVAPDGAVIMNNFVVFFDERKTSEALRFRRYDTHSALWRDGSRTEAVLVLNRFDAGGNPTAGTLTWREIGENGRRGKMILSLDLGVKN